MRAISLWQILLSTVVAVSIGFPAGASDVGQKRIAILPFTTQVNGHGINSYTAVQVGDALSTDLIHSGSFHVYDRSHLDAIMKEHSIAESGLMDPATASKIGHLTGVQYVAYGDIESADEDKTGKNILGLFNVHSNVSIVQASVVVHFVVVDVETGQIETESRITGTATYDTKNSIGAQNVAYLNAATSTAKTFTSQIDFDAGPRLTGKVIDKTDQYVIVSLGSHDGIAEGTSLSFYRVAELKDASGQPIIDPGTGGPMKATQNVMSGRHNDKQVFGQVYEVQRDFSMVNVGSWNQRKKQLDQDKDALDAIQKGDMCQQVRH